jgi:hypothetical protein
MTRSQDEFLRLFQLLDELVALDEELTRRPTRPTEFPQGRRQILQICDKVMAFAARFRVPAAQEADTVALETILTLLKTIRPARSSIGDDGFMLSYMAAELLVRRPASIGPRSVRPLAPDCGICRRGELWLILLARLEHVLDSTSVPELARVTACGARSLQLPSVQELILRRVLAARVDGAAFPATLLTNALEQAELLRHDIIDGLNHIDALVRPRRADSVAIADFLLLLRNASETARQCRVQLLEFQRGRAHDVVALATSAILLLDEVDDSIHFDPVALATRAIRLLRCLADDGVTARATLQYLRLLTRSGAAALLPLEIERLEESRNIGHADSARMWERLLLLSDEYDSLSRDMSGAVAVSESRALACLRLGQKLLLALVNLRNHKRELASSVYRNITTVTAFRLIDAYDWACKNNLILLSAGEYEAYFRYLDWLSEWQAAIRKVAGDELRPFQITLTAYRLQQVRRLRRKPDFSFVLRSWTGWFHHLARPLEPVNVHELHNVIHQSSLQLLGLRYPMAVEGFALEVRQAINAFAKMECPITDVRVNSVAAELNMSAHKTPMYLGTRECRWEFVEGPGTDQTNCGRVVSIRAWLDLYLEQHPSLSASFGEVMVGGDFVFSSEIRPRSAQRRLTLGEIRELMYLSLMLYEGHTDYSGIPVSDVRHVRRLLRESRFYRRALNALLAHRSQQVGTAESVGGIWRTAYLRIFPVLIRQHHAFRRFDRLRSFSYQACRRMRAELLRRFGSDGRSAAALDIVLIACFPMDTFDEWYASGGRGFGSVETAHLLHRADLIARLTERLRHDARASRAPKVKWFVKLLERYNPAAARDLVALMALQTCRARGSHQ